MPANATPTEKAILKAAEEEFMLKGYGGARTTAIAERAGVTHAMLHYYFRKKETLFDRILQEKIELITSQFLSLFTQDKSLPITERIRLAIESHFDLLIDNPHLPGFVLAEMRNHPQLLDGWFSKLRNLFIPLIASLQSELDKDAAEGKICHVDAAMLFMDMVALNITSIASADVLCRIYKFDRDTFLAMRKKENVTVIMKRLLPCNA